MAFGRNDINVRIGAQDSTATAFKSAETRMNSFVSRARNIAGVMSGLLGARMLQRQVMAAVEYGSSLTDAAAATRVGVEEFQVLKYAAQEAGTDMDKVTMALAKIQKATNDAKNGLTTYTRAFDALGINIEKFQNLSPDKQLEMLGRAMVKSKDPAVAYASVLDLIGSRNAPRLMEVLKRLGTEGFSAVSAAAKSAGQVMSEVDAENLDQAADSLAELQTRITLFTADKVSFWLQFFDALKNGADSVENLRYDVEGLLSLFEKSDKIFGKIGKVLNYPVADIPKLFGAYGKQEDPYEQMKNTAAGINLVPDTSNTAWANPAPDNPPQNEPAQNNGISGFTGYADLPSGPMGLDGQDWVRISKEQLEALKEAKRLQLQQLTLTVEMNEQLQSQIKNVRD